MSSPLLAVTGGAAPPHPGLPAHPALPAPPAHLLAAVLARFPPASLALLQARALLQRSDTKFLLPTAVLPALLHGLSAHYAVLSEPSALGAPYRTLYFDTAERRFFHDHRRGRRLRHKLRIRTYAERRLTFLEIKSRRSSALTDKARIELPYDQVHLDGRCAALIRERCQLDGAQLRPQLWIDYRRLTLIGLEREERCTFDFSLSVSNVEHTRSTAAFDGLAFLELKQPEPDPSSPMMRALRALQQRPRSISKYLVAVCELHPRERANLLRPTLRALHELRAGAGSVAA
jgi:hypothetical protein